MPGTPGFGWRVETLQKNGWKLKAEGGPVRLLTTSGRSDPHVAVTGSPPPVAMVRIAPTHAFDFSFFLPGAEAALRPDPGVMLTTLKLTVYWAAPANLAQSNRDVPLCSLSGEWDVKIRRPRKARWPISARCWQMWAYRRNVAMPSRRHPPK